MISLIFLVQMRTRKFAFEIHWPLGEVIMYFQLSISKISKILFFSTATTNSTCNLSGINHYTSEEIFSALRNSHLYPCHSITRSTTFCPFFCDLLPIFTWTSFALLYLFYTVKSIKLNIYYSLLMVTLSIHLLSLVTLYTINQEKTFCTYKEYIPYFLK